MPRHCRTVALAFRRVAWRTCIAALALVACGKRREQIAPIDAKPAIVAKPALAHTHGCELRAEVVPDAPRFAVGEPGYVTFRVTTSCAEPLKMLVVADSGNALGRPNSYRVSAVDAKGNGVEAIEIDNDQGGGEGLRELGPKRPLEQRLVLAHWMKISSPGLYELTVKRALMVGRSRADLERVPFHVSTPIEVTP